MSNTKYDMNSVDNTKVTNDDNLIEGKYSYYAFICYNHDDYKEAKELYDFLYKYRLPIKLAKAKNKKRKLVPHFLDVDEMPPRDYDTADVDALSRSKFLIVVCSRNLKNDDKNVNDEIVNFLACGNSYNSVIPYIIDKSSKPEIECFPSAILEMRENGYNKVGANIFLPDGKKNKRKARIKIIAEMHGFKNPAELETPDKRRRFRNRLFTGVIIAVALISAFIIWQIVNRISMSTLVKNGPDGWVTTSEIESNVGKIIDYETVIKNVDKADNPIVYINLNPNLQFKSGHIESGNSETILDSLDEKSLNEGIDISKYNEDTICIYYSVQVLNYDLKIPKDSIITKTSIRDGSKLIDDYNIIDVSFEEKKLNEEDMVVGWGDNVGGRNVYTMYQVYNEGILGDTITFNSITDDMNNGGDERNFVSARKDIGKDPDKYYRWHDNVVYVTGESQYVISMYVHNDNPKGLDAVAENVIAHVNMPETAGNILGVQCSFDSFNAVPTHYYDGINFKGDRPFRLEYVKGSAKIINAGIGNDDGYKLDDNLITSYGVPLGYDQLDGKVPGGKKYASRVLFKVRVIFED